MINRRSRLTDTFHVHIYDHCGTLKNPHTIRKEQGMKFPVLWLAFVSLSVWVGTEKRGTPRKGLSVPFAYHLALRC